MKLNNPVFKPVPRSHLADVPENIDNFIDKGKKDQLELLCRPHTGMGSHRGYRFVRADELTETVRTQEKYKWLQFEMEHTVKYMAVSSFLPLNFIPCRVMSIYILPDGVAHPFVSKAQLKRDLNDYINSLK